MPEVTDSGCCSPYPLRKTCEAPVIPVPDCDEQNPVIVYDEETEEFFVTTIMFDSECSPLQDDGGSELLSIIS